jgi:hypothetical protein
MDVKLDEIRDIATNEIAKKEGSTQPKVSLSFELNRSSLLKVTKAEVKMEEYVRTEIKPDEEKDKTEDSDKKEDSDAADAEAVEGDEPVAEPVEPEFKEEMVPHSYPLLPSETLIDCRLLNKE